MEKIQANKSSTNFSTTCSEHDCTWRQETELECQKNTTLVSSFMSALWHTQMTITDK